MNISWSHNLFLRINRSLGKHPWRDRFMHICGHELIYILAFLLCLWATSALFATDPNKVTLWIKLLMTALSTALATSWLIALLFPHKRPVAELPNVVQLVRPMSTWKSFPSDHTIVAFVLVEISMFMGTPLWFSIIMLVLASLVAIGRVYIGVHYPRDIIGGMIVATLFSFSAFFWLEQVTEPVYRLFIQLFMS